MNEPINIPSRAMSKMLRWSLENEVRMAEAMLGDERFTDMFSPGYLEEKKRKAEIALAELEKEQP